MIKLPENTQGLFIIFAICLVIFIVAAIFGIMFIINKIGGKW